MTKTALITGASSGIGEEFAKQYAKKGYQLILVARRKDRLESLIQELKKDSPQKMVAISSDLADPNAVPKLMDVLNTQYADMPVDILVNNAGFGLKKRISEQSPKDISVQLQVMVNALTELSHAVLPHMLAQKSGNIINVASLAAFAPPGEGTLYSAIKQYVVALSQSLDMEVKSKGINVTALCPGFTRTEFHDTMEAKHFAEKLPSIFWGNVKQVVDEGIKGNEKGKAVVTPRLFNKAIAMVSKHLPESIRYQLGKNQPVTKTKSR